MSSNDVEVEIKASAALAAIRRQVLVEWSPTEFFSPLDDRQSILSAWEGIRRAEREADWPATAGQCGRLVEGLLGAELLGRGVSSEQVGRSALGSLIRLAETHNVLLPGVMSLTSRGMSQHIRRLRNWGAHFSRDNSNSERNATQAICTLVAFVSAIRRVPSGLNRNARPRFDLGSEWERLSPTFLIKQSLMESRNSGHVPGFIINQQADFCLHCLKHGSMRSLAHLVHFWRSQGLDLSVLAKTIEQNFVLVLESTAWATSSGLYRAANKVGGLGLIHQRQILSAMAPIDMESLVKVIQGQSAFRAAWYIGAAARANPSTFGQAMKELRPKDLDRVSALLWAEYDGSSSFVANRAVLVAKFPPSVRLRFWREAPPGALEGWARVGVPPHVLGALWVLCRDQMQVDSGYMADRMVGRALSAAETRLRTAPLNTIRNIPWVLRYHLSVPASSPFFQLSSEVLLERVQEEWLKPKPDERSACRLLLDILQLGHEPDAVLAAVNSTLNWSVFPANAWNHAMLIGLCYVAAGAWESAFVPIFHGANADSALLAEWIENSSATEAFLSAVGMSISHGLGRSSLPQRLLLQASGVTSQNKTVFSRRLQRLESLWKPEAIAPDLSSRDGRDATDA